MYVLEKVLGVFIKKSLVRKWRNEGRWVFGNWGKSRGRGVGFFRG